MGKVIIDTNIWIDYFKYGKHQKDVAFLLEEERIATTDTILAEILPIFIRDKNSDLIEVMRSFEKYTTFINWEGIITSQVVCLKNGLNKVGLIDLMIAQAAIEYSVEVFTNDKHFHKMSKFLNLKIYKPKYNE